MSCAMQQRLLNTASAFCYTNTSNKCKERCKKKCTLCLLIGKRIKAFKSSVAKTGWQLLLSLLYQQWSFCSSVTWFVHFYMPWTDSIIPANLTQCKILQRHQFRPGFQSLLEVVTETIFIQWLSVSQILFAERQSSEQLKQETVLWLAVGLQTHHTFSSSGLLRTSSNHTSATKASNESHRVINASKTTSHK